MKTSGSKSHREWVADHVRDIPRSGIRDFFDIVSTMKDIISLGIGEPDFDTPWHVRESTVFSLERGATHYTSNLGLLELRKSIAGYVNKFFKASYNPETEILVTVGVSEALDLALRALINPGDEVMYHEPCYVSYRSDVILAHGTPVTVEAKKDNQFRLTPLGNGEVQWEITGDVDLGLPYPMINLAMPDLLFKGLSDQRKLVLTPKYQQARLISVREP